MTLILEKSHHRNGVYGEPFDVYIVNDGEGRRMLVVNFRGNWGERTGGPVCAAFDVDLLADGVIRFGENSHRGDQWRAEVERFDPIEPSEPIAGA